MERWKQLKNLWCAFDADAKNGKPRSPYHLVYRDGISINADVADR